MERGYVKVSSKFLNFRCCLSVFFSSLAKRERGGRHLVFFPPKLVSRNLDAGNVRCCEISVAHIPDHDDDINGSFM